MQKEKNNLNFIFMNMLLLLYFIELVFPPITTVYNSLAVRLGCMAGWIFMSFWNNKRFYEHGSIHITYVLVFCAATVIIPYIFGESTIGNRYLDLMLVPMGYFIFCYYKECDHLEDLKKILMITSFFILLTYFDTLQALLSNSYVSRGIKSSGTKADDLFKEGIGGYSFVYLMVVVSVLLLYMFLKTKSRRMKVITFLGTGMAFFFVLKANYTTALVTAFFAGSVLILMNYAKRGIKNNLLLLFFIIVFFLLLSNLRSIVQTFSDFIPRRVAEAITPRGDESVFDALAVEFLWDRWPAMKGSMDAFFQNPLLGLVGAGGIGYSSGYLAGFGQHSHILDTFALLGGLFGIVNIFVVLRPLKDNKGKWIAYGKPINMAMLVCMIGIYLFNNATESVALAFGIMFPVLREHYDLENESEKEVN